MRNTYLTLAFIVGLSFTTFGQDLNSYKYVVVPERFDFLKESNQYQLNELTKFLFEKYGFTAFLSNEEKPLDWNSNPCNILHAVILPESGLFKTGLQVVLKDCQDKDVFISKKGASRDKDYKAAYQEALRDAFSSIEAINYVYQQKPTIELSGVVANKAEKVEEAQPKQRKMEQQPEEVIVSAVPQAVIQTPKVEDLGAAANAQSTYVLGNVEFYILDAEFGYQLFLKQINEPFAKLVKTESAGHYIYSTIQGHGIAYFDKDGNLKVEILNAKDNSTLVKTYSLKDQ